MKLSVDVSNEGKMFTYTHLHNRHKITIFVSMFTEIQRNKIAFYNNNYSMWINSSIDYTNIAYISTYTTS